MEFFKADTQHTEILRKIAHDSESYWGYCKQFMDKFDETFNITDSFIRENPVYIGTIDQTITCFWGTILDGSSCELEYFYISVEHIKNGFGRVMWEHFVGWCRENKINKISLVTSPDAIGFYEKMGCILIGEVPSSIDGRMIPRFRFTNYEEEKNTD